MNIAGCSQKKTLIKLLFSFFILSIYITPNLESQVFKFAETACDSTICKEATYTNSSDKDTVFLSDAYFSEGKNFSVKKAVFPMAIPPHETRYFSVCFNPKQRGNVSDNLVYKELNGMVTQLRVEGKGVGPEITASNISLIFPRTNPGNTSAPMPVLLKNIGERPITLNTANLRVSSPFNLLATLPKTLATNDTFTIFINFSPNTAGVYSQTLEVIGGCSNTVSIGLNGFTDVNGTGAIIQTSKNLFDPTQITELSCGKDTCGKIIVTNLGSSALKVDSMFWLSSDKGYYLSTKVPTPFFVPINSKKEIEICFKGKGNGFAKDTFRILSNSRNSIAFGLVLDESGSMNNGLKCPSDPAATRMSQTKKQATNFINNTLVNLPSAGVVDELAVFACAIRRRGNQDDSLRILTNLKSADNVVKKAATDAISIMTSSGGTSTRLVMRKMIAELGKSKLNKKVLIVITDASSTGGSEPEDIQKNPEDVIVREAKAAGVTIFPIGIGTDNFAKNSMQSIAAKTNGIFFDVSDCGNLQTAFETITSTLSEGTVRDLAFAAKLSVPDLRASGIDFDSVAIGDTVCKKIFITNEGLGDAIIDDIKLAEITGISSDEYLLGKGIKTPIVIQEKQQINFDICFAPKKIKSREARINMRYNSCNGEILNPKLNGIGVAEIGLSITGKRIVKPGDIITVPINVGSSITRFDISKIVFGVRWSKTMLEFNRVIPSAIANGTTFNVTKPTTFTGNKANIEITANTGKFSNSGEMAKVEFTVLRGDSMQSNVEISYGKFDDGNPKARLYDTTAIIQYDTSCFYTAIPVKDINSFVNFNKLVFGEVTPNPVQDNAVSVAVSSELEGILNADLTDEQGKQIFTNKSFLIKQGDNNLRINLPNISSGVYFIRFNAGSKQIISKKIIINK